MAASRASGAANIDGYMYFVGEGKRKTRTGSTMKVGIIKGECQDAIMTKANAFAINTFSWDTKPSGTEGKDRQDVSVKVEPFKITKEVDEATPLLFQASVLRASFDAAHVVFRKAGGDKHFKFLRFRFTNVIIESWALDYSGEVPTETVSFSFTWCEIRYKPQSHQGNVPRTPVSRAFCIPTPESTTPPVALTTEPKDEELDNQAMNLFDQP